MSEDEERGRASDFESDDDDETLPRLAGRNVQAGGAVPPRSAKYQSQSGKGFERPLLISRLWLEQRYEQGPRAGEPMFASRDIRGRNSKPLGTNLQKLLHDRPEVQNPPSKQPVNVRNAKNFLRVTEARIDPSEKKRSAGSISAACYYRVISAVKADSKSMRSACGDPACPTCRLPEEQQPDERYLFFHDVVFWWNACRGKCMAKGCRRALQWHKEIGEKGGDGWSLQRGDHQINHYASNIVGVLCGSCNSRTSAAVRCIHNRAGTFV